MPEKTLGLSARGMPQSCDPSTLWSLLVSDLRAEGGAGLVKSPDHELPLTAMWDESEWNKPTWRRMCAHGHVCLRVVCEFLGVNCVEATFVSLTRHDFNAQRNQPRHGNPLCDSLDVALQRSRGGGRMFEIVPVVNKTMSLEFVQSC